MDTILWMFYWILMIVAAVGVSFIVSVVIFYVVKLFCGDEVERSRKFVVIMILAWWLSFEACKSVPYNPIPGWIIAIWLSSSGMLIASLLIFRQSVPEEEDKNLNYLDS